MIRILCKTIVWVLVSIFYRHRVYGKEHIPKGGGIIASNHSSFLDPPLIGISCPGKIYFLARDTLFRFPAFAWLLRQLAVHPLRRGKGNINAFKKAMELVQSGKKVVLFPEGSRSPNGQLQEGQAGIGMLVQRTCCQVIPVYVYGTFEAWNSRRKFPKFIGKTACIFGSPIPYAECVQEEKKGAQAMIVAKIMDKIAELKEWYLSGAQGSPP
jgi:1-acyl-sn-glycerol-3-phosphate acyltransferase